MGTRLELQHKLEELLDSKHVYYQPPENQLMEYPAIRYSKSDILSQQGNNMKYCKFNCYDIVIIARKPDNPVIEKILELPYSSFDRHYTSDGLNHDIIKLYF